MSVFRLQPQKSENSLNPHPWSRTIKDEYSNIIKHAHNSIHNPNFPVKQEKKRQNTERVTFSIIGDRVVKEFTYCKNLVKGLFKYRPKLFNAPVIRGVTTVEWPIILNELKIKYGGLAFCLSSSVAVLVNDTFLGGDKELKGLVESKYIYHIHPDYYHEGISEFARFIRASGRSCAYMHIAVNDEHIGTLIFMLFSDILPYTCENFLRLCKDKKGGYSGTPIHRIVKDGWIQCGGYGIKNSKLSCENFIIPHDRRGVLGMANDGRHVDCSTQFFVLLQPSQWMASKYVAFGQLIDGEETLKKIENIPTWYESPISEITITQSGIFNMECHDIMINRGAKEYIQGHIEDLYAIEEIFYEELLEKVFLEISFREMARLRALLGEDAEGEESPGGMRTTERFLRKKEEIEKQLEKSKIESVDSINNEFDVEEYAYEPEEYSYKHVSPAAGSSIPRPDRNYYIPLTDVPYPGEVDSTFDLKRFLQGDYCLESDLQQEIEKKVDKERVDFASEIIAISSSDSASGLSLDSDEEMELKNYIALNVDKVSFAGGVVKNIARGLEKYNILDSYKRSELISDDELRRFRVSSMHTRNQEYDSHKRLITITDTSSGTPQIIKRRQTGFVRPKDLEKVHVFNTSNSEDSGDDGDEEQTPRKVRIAASTKDTVAPRPCRRPTGYVRRSTVEYRDSEARPSVLARLYDDVAGDDDFGPMPTLKDYRPLSEAHKKNILLTYSPYSRIKSAENTRENYMRNSLTVENESFEQVLNLQHGKKVARKISSDYVKTIDQIEQKLENSIRSVEFAKTRPTMSVSEYQMKNKKYQEDLKEMSSAPNTAPFKPKGGIRLPGDSPLYSMLDVM